MNDDGRIGRGRIESMFIGSLVVLWRGLLRPGLPTILLALGGCMVGPDYRAPQAKAPANWVSPTTVPTTQASIPTTQPFELTRWWQTFNDPTLDGLVNRAISSNLDLRQTEARLRQARASRAVVAAGLFPAIDATGLYRRS